MHIRLVVGLSVGLLGLGVAGCGEGEIDMDEPEDVGEAASAVEGDNALAMNALAMNAFADNALAMNALAMNALAMNSLTGNADLDAAMNDATPADPDVPSVTKGMLSRDLYSYIYSCAMPSTSSFTMTFDDNQQRTFTGLHNLAPGWGTGNCDGTCQRWVSACVLARTNAYGTPIDISMRGNHAALATSGNETTVYNRFEAVYYGNIFSSTTLEVNKLACRGAAAGNYAVTGRACAFKGGSCGIEVQGACSSVCTADANGNYTCPALGALGGTVSFPQTIRVYVKDPLPAACGNGVCDTGETVATCNVDCLANNSGADLEAGSSGAYVRGTAGLRAAAGHFFLAGETDSTGAIDLSVAKNQPLPYVATGNEKNWFLVKRSATGYSWGKRFVQHHVNVGSTLVRDIPKSIRLTGDQFQLIVSGDHFVAAHASANGSFVWRRPFNGSRVLAVGDSHAASTILWVYGHAGSYSSGSWSSTTGGAWVAALDRATGEELARLSTSSLPDHTLSAADLARDRLHVVEPFNGSNVKVSRISLAYTAGPAVTMTTNFSVDVSPVSGGYTAGAPKGTAIWSTNDGSVIYVTGHGNHPGTPANRAAFLARLTGAGTLVWLNLFKADSGNRSIVPLHLSAEREVVGANVAVAGDFRGPARFTGTLGSMELSPNRPSTAKNPNHDVFGAVYDYATGKLKYVDGFGGFGDDHLGAMVFDSNANVTSVGTFVGGANLAHGLVKAPSPTEERGFLSTFGPLPL